MKSKVEIAKPKRRGCIEFADLQVGDWFIFEVGSGNPCMKISIGSFYRPACEESPVSDGVEDITATVRRVDVRIEVIEES